MPPKKIDQNIFSIQNLKPFEINLKPLLQQFVRISNKKNLTDDNTDIDKKIQLLSIFSYLKNTSYNDPDTYYDILKRDIDISLNWNGIKTDLTPNIPSLSGGNTDNVWPIFQRIIEKDNKLEFTSAIDPSLKFSVNVPPSTDVTGRQKLIELVYPLQVNIKVKNSLDNQDYILIINKRSIIFNTRSHFYEEDNNYVNHINFYDNFMKIYYYGSINFRYHEVQKLDIPLKLVRENNTNQENYSFDYIITKEYNKIDSISSNKNKLEFLIKFVDLLLKLYENNYVLSIMNDDAIKVDNNNNPIIANFPKEQIILIKQNYHNTNFSALLKRPKTPFFMSNKTASYTREAYKMFSIGGLTNIIDKLNIQFQSDIKTLPAKLHIKSKNTIDLNNLINHFNLYNMDINNIFKYDEIKKILEWIMTNNFYLP